MKIMKAVILCVVLLVSTVLCSTYWSRTALALPATDVRGSSDHPILTRFPDSVIVKYRQVAYDEYVLPLGKATGKGAFERSEKVAGKLTSIEYNNAPGHSVIEIYENYEQALASAGYEVSFRCVKHPECGSALGDYFGVSWHNDSRYLAAKGGDPQAPTHVALFVYKRGSSNDIGVDLRVIESRPMKTGQVTATAATISQGLAAQGKFALYGLYFDTGKAVLKPESDAALAEVAQVLKGNPSLQLYVVGHTDSTGQVAANLDLSEQRAVATVKALLNRYGIAQNRLRPKGVGPFAPVGSNRTEDGRAKNRRVELVEQ